MTGPMDDNLQAQRAFRAALGSFATGVTIATTLDGAGAPVGVTASSFNSVSLDPPLVLWSLAKDSFSRPAFAKSGHFAVHVLAASQEALSNRFARSGEDKFAGVEWSEGRLGSPVLAHYAALFECRTRHQYEGGDHIIMVGEVVDFEARDEAPLLFHGGRYAEHRPRPEGEAGASVDLEHGRFSDDFLFQLISRAHYRTSAPTRRKLAELDLSMDAYMVLAILSMEAPLDAATLEARLAETGHSPGTGGLEGMASTGLLVETGAGYDLTEDGRKRFLEALAVGKAFEADLADHFSEPELAEAKRVLRRIIDLTGKDTSGPG